MRRNCKILLALAVVVMIAGGWMAELAAYEDYATNAERVVLGLLAVALFAAGASMVGIAAQGETWKQ